MSVMFPCILSPLAGLIYMGDKSPGLSPKANIWRLRRFDFFAPLA